MDLRVNTRLRDQTGRSVVLLVRDLEGLGCHGRDFGRDMHVLRYRSDHGGHSVQEEAQAASKTHGLMRLTSHWSGVPFQGILRYIFCLVCAGHWWDGGSYFM